MNYQYDVFISYSRLDTTIADKICDELDYARIKYFIDRQGIIGGGEFPDIIANAISNSQFFLFLASNNSYVSKYTKKEIHFAFNLKPDSLLPYIIDDSELPISLKFTFSDINIRTIKDHPIVETLVPDLLKLLGREKEIDIQKDRNWALNYLQLTDEWKIYEEKRSKLKKEQQNQIDDLGFLLVDYDDDSTPYLWDRFIFSLLKHEIIPVIGPEYQTANNENFHKQIVKSIAKEFGIRNEPDSFTQLVLSSEFCNYVHDINRIYRMIDNILHNYEAVPSPWLVSFIESKLFPFIINTSFTPTIENEMIKVWRNVKCLNYSNSIYNNPHIVNNCFLSTPTICYMFGKHNRQPHSFAVTEQDIRDFSKWWMLEYMDKVLYSALKQCHLLFIGYNPYAGDDSFLWKDLQREKDFGHRSFSEFLEVIGKGIIFAPEIVLKEINNRVMLMQEENPTLCDFDVFLSCPQANNIYMEELVKLFSENGLRVWYKHANENNHPYDINTIKALIDNSLFYIPIITESTTQNDNFYCSFSFSDEWKYAIYSARTFKNRLRGIIPFVINNGASSSFLIPEDLQDFDVKFTTKQKLNENAKIVISQIIEKRAK